MDKVQKRGLFQVLPKAGARAHSLDQVLKNFQKSVGDVTHIHNEAKDLRRGTQE